MAMGVLLSATVLETDLDTCFAFAAVLVAIVFIWLL
jgi:hypothetical protein